MKKIGKRVKRTILSTGVCKLYSLFSIDHQTPLWWLSVKRVWLEIVLNLCVLRRKRRISYPCVPVRTHILLGPKCHMSCDLHTYISTAGKICVACEVRCRGEREMSEHEHITYCACAGRTRVWGATLLCWERKKERERNKQKSVREKQIEKSVRETDRKERKRNR